MERVHLCLASTLGIPQHKGVSIDFIDVLASFSHSGLVCLPSYSFGHGQDQTRVSHFSAQRTGFSQRVRVLRFGISVRPAAATAAKSLQSCLTLCDLIDGSPQAPPSLGFSICDPGEQKYLKHVILKTTHLGFYFELSSLIRLIMK